eukprot:COSAG02_NODE_8716_length_2463_cov_3.172166_2_plen_118_part_00
MMLCAADKRKNSAHLPQNTANQRQQQPHRQQRHPSPTPPAKTNTNTNTNNSNNNNSASFFFFSFFFLLLLLWMEKSLGGLRMQRSGKQSEIIPTYTKHTVRYYYGGLLCASGFVWGL